MRRPAGRQGRDRRRFPSLFGGHDGRPPELLVEQGDGRPVARHRPHQPVERGGDQPLERLRPQDRPVDLVQGFEAAGQPLQGLRRELRGGDIPGDGRGADDPTGPVLDRGDRERHVDAAAVPGQPLRLVGLDPLAPPHPFEDRRQLIRPARRDQHGDGPADHLLRRIAVQRGGAGAPARDRPIQSLADDRVLR
jgi:hypothetical protein